jgi:hypothetical protein
MSEATRRGFLVIAGAGTGAAIAAIAAPTLFGDDETAETVDVARPLQPVDVESFVVHVKDVQTGRLAIMVGEREVLVTDRELAALLAGKTNA